MIGNDKAIEAYRAGKPFPEGTIIGRVAWKMVPSEENNKTFGQAQSFVPGDAPDWYLQFMEKDTRSTPRRAAGVTRILVKTSNRSPTKRLCTLAFPSPSCRGPRYIFTNTRLDRCGARMKQPPTSANEIAPRIGRRDGSGGA